MGYCMSQVSSEFFIKHADFKKVVKAIKALRGKETCGNHFSFVDEDFDELNNIGEIFEAWRWELEQEGPSGPIVGIEFRGEKAGDDLMLFKAIAPFVEAGSFVEMAGEDGEHWKWVFDGKTCKERTGRVVYDEPECGPV